MADRVDSPRVLNIADLRLLAKRRLPRVAFDYIDGGADGEVTLRENCRIFDDVMFRPRCAVSAPADLRTRVLGHDLALPFALAPVGSSRMFYPRGEVVAAGAAGEAGTAYTLSTLSGCRVDEVGAGTKGPLWYQLYLVGGRDVATAGLERAMKAGATALFVTIDTAVAGLRERDFRNGTKELLTRNPWTMLPFVHQFLLRPRWLAGFIGDGGLMNFPNVVLKDGPMSYADVGAALEQSTVCWADLRWIREVWKGPIVIKGLMIGDDARRAVDEGAQGVVVSNHGGRQLDCVYPTLRALPEVVAAVNGQCEVLLDGGIRRGTDIAKALCMGARAVLIGRAYAYGLGAGGRAGVSRTIQILRADLIRALKLLGCPSVAELDESYVTYPADWRSQRDAQRAEVPRALKSRHVTRAELRVTRSRLLEERPERDVEAAAALEAHAAAEEHRAEQRLEDGPAGDVALPILIVPIVERRSAFDPGADKDVAAEHVGHAANPAQVPATEQQVVVASQLIVVERTEPQRTAEREVVDQRTVSERAPTLADDEDSIAASSNAPEP